MLPCHQTSYYFYYHCHQCHHHRNTIIITIATLLYSRVVEYSNIHFWCIHIQLRKFKSVCYTSCCLLSAVCCLLLPCVLYTIYTHHTRYYSHCFQFSRMLGSFTKFSFYCYISCQEFLFNVLVFYIFPNHTQ